MHIFSGWGQTQSKTCTQIVWVELFILKMGLIWIIARDSTVGVGVVTRKVKIMNRNILIVINFGSTESGLNNVRRCMEEDLTRKMMLIILRGGISLKNVFKAGK